MLKVRLALSTTPAASRLYHTSPILSRLSVRRTNKTFSPKYIPGLSLSSPDPRPGSRCRKVYPILHRRFNSTPARYTMSPPQSVLIIGGSKGLGKALVEKYASQVDPGNVFVTVRGDKAEGMPQGVNVIPNVDCSKSDVGKKIVDGLKGTALEVVVYVAGILIPEEFGQSKWDAEVSMYTVCSIAPVFVVESLVMSSSLTPSAKIILLTSEGGSITLRTAGEGGGMFGHHGSKAAGNMIGHILSYDLKERGISIAMIHPGFLKTEMTKGAGMEDSYEAGGAVTPDEAAVPFVDFVEKLTPEMSGKFWAPMGGKGIGNAEEVMGKKAAESKGPLELPW